MPITIFTDGSSRGNPGPGGWAAIVSDGATVREHGGREAHTTNNKMELSGAIHALESVARTEGAVVIHTDSKYVIKGITEWVSGWKRNGWKTAAKKDVENRDLWEALDAASRGLSISWVHVDGHAGVPANERCDLIATSFADGASVDLYSGPAEKYPVDLSITKAAAAVPKAKKSSGAKAYSYLSMIDGVIERHSTWAECESRVKGKSGARFRKSLSAADEAAIIESWK